MKREPKERLTRRRDCYPYLVYSLLSLGIMGVLLLPGYVLTLDMVFGPHTAIEGKLYGLDEWRIAASTPLWLLIDAASRIPPAWVCQKIILFLIFFLCGLGAHRLFPFKGAGSYFAGVLYMVNPFTYVRLMAGQWGVLGAYALMPFAIKAFIDLLERQDRRQAAKVALLSTLVGVFQVHGYLFLFIAFAVILLVRLVHQRRERVNLRISRAVALAGVMFVALNLYWLVPALTASDTLLEEIGQSDLLVFAPRPSTGAGTMFDLAAMYGFWRDGYQYASDTLPCWWLGFAFIFYLSVLGLVHESSSDRIGWVVRAFGIIWLVGLTLAAGAAIEFSRPLLEWLFDHLYLFRGFRDSHKFVALLCLCYSYLGGLGVYHVTESWRSHRFTGPRLRQAALTGTIALAFVVPLAYSYPIFSFNGQLKPTDYPDEWHQVNEYLNQDEDDFNVLFLPWHMYMDYDWLPNKDKRLLSPVSRFFDKPAIWGDNIQAGGIYSQSTNPTSSYLEFLLARADSIGNLGELLAPLNVRYVVLFHEADWESYGFLREQQDLAVEIEGKHLTLFRNQRPTARAYGVDSVVYVDNLEEYLQLSVEQDVMQHLYLLGPGEDKGPAGAFQPLEVVQHSPTRYEIEGTEKTWTIFTVPQRINSEHWQYGSSPTCQNLGLMPAFQVGEDGGQITYSRFYTVYLPAYCVSATALLVLAAGYALALKRRPAA